MRIALINENSQAVKNELIAKVVSELCKEKGYDFYNYGMINEQDKPLTYVQVGLLAGILLNSGACDFVITGCGTGQGAMLALNSFPNVFCGLIVDPTDAYLFSQINDGNAIALPFAKGFGWGSELTLKNILEQLFSSEFGGGYPKERREAEQFNKNYLCQVKQVTCNDMLDIVKNLDSDFVRKTIERTSFEKYFFQCVKHKEYRNYFSQFFSNK